MAIETDIRAENYRHIDLGQNALGFSVQTKNCSALHQGLGALVPQAQNIGRYVTNLLRRENEKRHGGMYVGGKPEVKSCRGHPRACWRFLRSSALWRGGTGSGRREQRDMRRKHQVQADALAEYDRRAVPELP